MPRYLRVVAEPPRTATGKVVVRELARHRWDGDGVWIRDGAVMRPMSEADKEDLTRQFLETGRPLV